MLSANYKKYRAVYLSLHIMVLALSVYLVITISIDTFQGVNFYSPRFLHTQFWICMAFMLDFLVELILSPRRWHFLRRNFLFFVFSIPYLAIFNLFDVAFSPEVAYLVQYIPLIRGGYALAIVVGWFTYNRAASIFVTYIVTLLATVYFASLVFFLFESKLNPGVKTYGDALWWALMDMTTVGSNIYPMTYEGKVLAVLLAALGMMMFPIFTVFITSVISRNRQHTAPALPGRVTVIPPSVLGDKTADITAHNPANNAASGAPPAQAQTQAQTEAQTQAQAAAETAEAPAATPAGK